MSRRLALLLSSLALLALLLAACGARTALDPGDSGAAGDGWGAFDRGADLGLPCAPLVGRRGNYRGTWRGIVNCLVEKHPTEGTLSFALSSKGAPAEDGLRVSGHFSGTFSNGLSLQSRVVGQVACSGQPRVDLVDITVGNAQVAQVTGWLRNWIFSPPNGSAFQVSGTWRIDLWEPLCIGAGTWVATRDQAN